MIRFIMAIVQAIAQLIASGVGAGIAFLDWLATRLSGGGSAPASPIPNLEMALPEPERLQRAEELAAGEVKAVDNLMTRSPAQQAQIFASMDKDDRILADLSLLRPDQIDWLNGLVDGQLRMIAEAPEKRVAAALAGEHNAMPAILSVGQPKPLDETGLAHRLAAKRASQLAPTHPAAYGLQ
jgi:hypothetical protein